MDKLSQIWVKSDDVVERNLDGEVILVPLASGVGDLEDELFALNPIGQAIWALLDGSRTTAQMIEQLMQEFEADRALIETDVIGFLEELGKRKLIVERKGA
ncbi:MAG: PqqD family protein [Anaerolineales bacterium]|nr:PqqD family protein [Anaerolineales bacterium]